MPQARSTVLLNLLCVYTWFLCYFTFALNPLLLASNPHPHPQAARLELKTHGTARGRGTELAGQSGGSYFSIMPYFLLKDDFFFFLFLATPHSTRDLSSPTRDQTHAPCSRSWES